MGHTGLIILIIILFIVGGAMGFLFWEVDKCTQGEGGLICKTWAFFM